MFPGSKWYKFDIHTHTPHSFDYGRSDANLKNSITPVEWLHRFIAHGIQCVAITDHNSGAAIDEYKAAALELQTKGLDIIIFPGVEISVSGGVHILAIFDPSKTSTDIASLLGAVQYYGTHGDSNRVTEISPRQVVSIIQKFNGVAIPAHIDKGAGCCKELKGNTLKDALENVDAVEIINLNADNLGAYRSYKLNYPELLGSDSHHPDEVGQSFSWLKMETPNIDGLKLSLIDGKSSVIRSDSDHAATPNRPPASLIASFNVENTKYIGAKKPLSLNFSPWLNSITGGRGTGKSSIIEFIRITMGQDSELSSHNEINNTFKNLIRSPTSYNSAGLFKESTKLTIHYIKNEETYQITWTQKGCDIHRKAGQEWILEKGIVHERFPIKVFSQKQIFEISKSTNSLLRLIDNSKEIDIQNWRIQLKREISGFQDLKSTLVQNTYEIANKAKLEGDRADIQSRLSQFGKSTRNLELELYRRLDSIRGFIRGHQPKIKNTTQSILESIESLRPLHIPTYTKGDSPSETEVLNRLSTIDSLIVKNGTLAKKAITEILDAVSEFSEWQENSSFSYNILRVLPEVQESINSERQLGNYHTLHAELDKTESSLAKIEELEDQCVKLTESMKSSKKKVIELRETITEKRKNFITRHFSNFQALRVDINPFADLPESLISFNKIFEDHNKQNNLYKNQDPYITENITHLNHLIKRAESNLTKIKIIESFKENLLNGIIFEKPAPTNIQDRIKFFSREVETNILSWFPEDELRISFKDQSGQFRSIVNSSAGQRSAAILSLILAYGSEPLILDQPEDDLDNKLIGTLIVDRLKELKTNRQVIIATHNSTLVINGDSELVIALDEIKGQCHIKAAAGIQRSDIRRHICEIMEGGKELFEKRYKRLLKAL